MSIRDLFRRKAQRATDAAAPLVPVCAPDECARLQASLDELRKKYNVIYEHSPLMVARIDTNGVLRDINPRVKDWLGYAPHELIGHALDKLPFSTPESLARAKSSFARRLAGAHVPPYEVEFKAKSGETIVCEVHGVVLRTVGGVVEGELALMVNINDRIRAQQEIIESERKYRAMFEASPETIMLLDTRGNVLDMNQRVKELLDISPDEIVGKNLLALSMLSMRDRLRAIGSVLKRMRGKTVPPYEMTFHGKEGRVRIGEVRGKILRGAGDKIVGDVVIVTDVTEKKASENERIKIEEELRRTLAFRTEILSTVSHELRIPLTNILGFAGLLGDEKRYQFSDNARHAVARISSNAETLLRLVNSILAAATIDHGELETAAEEFDLAALIKGCVERMRGMRDAGEVALTFQVAQDMRMFADREKLEAIVLNLLSNALKFTDRGEVSITAAVCSDAPDCVCIVVRDTGIGIPEDKRTYIFEKFAQADVSTTRARRGTGLGLYIVKSYATLMGGTITVESEVDKGSTFTVKVPIETVARTASAREAR